MARGKRQKVDDGGEEHALAVFQEGMVRCVVAAKGAKQPGSVPGFCNAKMRVNRDVSVLAVAAAAMERNEREPGLPLMKCIDAFTSSGILGLRWCVESAVLSGCELAVTMNDLSKDCAALATHNALANLSDEHSLDPKAVEPWGDSNRLVELKIPGTTRGTTHVTVKPAGVALHDQPHDFIHLDPFGSAAPHLDAAVSRAPHLGVVAVTATDTAALWGIYPAVARRHYGAELDVGDNLGDGVNNLGGAAGQARRPPWFRELGVRVLLGAMARAAARHDRGIVPLSCLASDHFVQVCVRVQRGAAAADRSCSDDAVGAFWHCDVCDVAACGGWGGDGGGGERGGGGGGEVGGSNPGGGGGGVSEGAARSSSRPCAHARSLGPGWLGPLGDVDFLRRMERLAETSTRLARDRRSSAFASSSGVRVNPKPNPNPGAHEPLAEGVHPRTLKLIRRLIEEARGPPLFRNASRYTGAGVDPPPMDAVVDALRDAGYARSSRTHFDAAGVRTDAPPEEIRRIVSEVAARRVGERWRRASEREGSPGE